MHIQYIHIHTYYPNESFELVFASSRPSIHIVHFLVICSLFFVIYVVNVHENPIGIKYTVQKRIYNSPSLTVFFLSASECHCPVPDHWA
jgi:hypothetical protein